MSDRYDKRYELDYALKGANLALCLPKTLVEWLLAGAGFSLGAMAGYARDYSDAISHMRSRHYDPSAHIYPPGGPIYYPNLPPPVHPEEVVITATPYPSEKEDILDRSIKSIENFEDESDNLNKTIDNLRASVGKKLNPKVKDLADNVSVRITEIYDMVNRVLVESSNRRRPIKE